jgi:hypothetical protein
MHELVVMRSWSRVIWVPGPRRAGSGSPAWYERPVVPIHSDAGDRFCELFSRVERHADGD